MTLYRARNKLEGKHPKEPRGKHGKAWYALDKNRPDDWANLADKLTDPLARSVAESARETGVCAEAARALAKKLESGPLAQVAQDITEVKSERLRNLAAFQAERILGAITDEDIQNAKLRDKAVSAAVIVDKYLLLSNRPTEIVRIEDHRGLADLMKAMLEVAEHRGMEIEINPADPTARPAIGPAAPYNPHADRPNS
jgi:hypothetical protein